MSSRTLTLAAGALLSLTSIIPALAQDNINLAPQWQPQPQTDSQRLESFQPPPSSSQSYPSIQSSNGEPRLYIDPNHSIGGSVSPGSVEGNYRFPLPGQ